MEKAVKAVTVVPYRREFSAAFEQLTAPVVDLHPRVGGLGHAEPP